MATRNIKSAFVTGADGFIGSHLVDALVASGVRVKALALYNSFGRTGWLEHLEAETKKSIEVVSGDIRDPHQMRRYVKGCDTVFNLAALIGIPYSYLAPQSYVDTNITGTLNLLEASRESGVERFIQTSTSEIYGSAQFVPMTEEHPVNAQSPYAATKVAADQLALSFHRSFQLPVSVLRPFNNFGPRQSTRAIIPTLITQLLAKVPTLKVGSLSPTRDFLYVEDTAQAFILAARAEGSVGEIINAGSNFEISVEQLIRSLFNICGHQAEIVTEEARIRPGASEVTRLWCDNSKAKKLLTWQPKFTGLEGFGKRLEQTVEWYSRWKDMYTNLEYAV